MPSREQIARIIAPDAFKKVQVDVEYYQTHFSKFDPNSDWMMATGQWPTLASNLMHNAEWQEVAQAWDKADKIIELFQSPYTDQEQIDDLEMLDEDDGLNLYRRLLKNYMGE